jgi:hypothetical protein
MDIQDSVNITSAGKNGASLEAVINGGRLRIRDSNSGIPVELSAGLNVAVLSLGNSGFDGNITLRNAAGHNIITVSGRDGDIVLCDSAGKQTIRLSGELGDLLMTGADAAEDFDIADDAAGVSAGTVMVIDPNGKLRESTMAYDRRVAGIISGAGDYHPGITLGSSVGSGPRRPIALAGKVYCKADAAPGPICVGDLLTTSATPGHAMRVGEPHQALGAVIGKALQSLPAGQSLISVLVALQ